ncbi:hypothetical protein ACFTY8_19445 [Streptomyces mirabilis]|uniref:hypothetical protein n=1 Tax=Streptomyces mirabilis TaxID=68239 RepID=UPI00362CC8C9
MNVDDVIRERIEAARRKAENDKRRREELAAARAAGLAHRHAQKLRNLNRGDTPTVASAARTETPAPSKETPMAATKPVHVLLLCPACRAQRRCRPVGTAVVGKRRREVVECGDKSCGLQWVAAREHLDATPTAA